VSTISDGPNGIFIYTTLANHFQNQRGNWGVQAKYTFNGGAVLYSDIKRFKVGDTLGS